MRYTEPYQISICHLDEVSIIRQASPLYLLFKLLDELIVGVQFVHIVMREGELGLEVAIVVEHLCCLNDMIWEGVIGNDLSKRAEMSVYAYQCLINLPSLGRRSP